MTQTARKSANISRSIRGIPLEIQKRIRIFSAAQGLNAVDFFEQYMTQLMEYLGSESPDISVAASIVMGTKIYPYQNEGGRDIWSIRIRDTFSEILFKFGHATTGSVESFIRESIIQFGKRLPPSDQIIRGFNRRMERTTDHGREKVAYDNWDGHVDVAQDTPEGDREL